MNFDSHFRPLLSSCPRPPRSVSLTPSRTTGRPVGPDQPSHASMTCDCELNLASSLARHGMARGLRRLNVPCRNQGQAAGQGAHRATRRPYADFPRELAAANCRPANTRASQERRRRRRAGRGSGAPGSGGPSGPKLPPETPVLARSRRRGG